MYRPLSSGNQVYLLKYNFKVLNLSASVFCFFIAYLYSTTTQKKKKKNVLLHLIYLLLVTLLINILHTKRDRIRCIKLMYKD